MSALSVAPTTSAAPARPDASRSSATEATPTLVLTGDGWLIGEIVGIQGRVIDALAGLRSIGLMTSDGYLEVDRDEVLAVVPPASASRAELRIAKRRMPVVVDLSDEISVRGDCHLLPGSTVWDVWQRSASGFAALTDAELAFADGGVETADVVLVSRHAAAAGLRRL